MNKTKQEVFEVLLDKYLTEKYSKYRYVGPTEVAEDIDRWKERFLMAEYER